MRTKTFLITGCIMILFTGVLFAQESEAEHNALPKKMEYLPINVPVDVKKCLDIIFPGVIFQYEKNLSRRGVSNGIFEAVYQDKTYEMPLGFNSLLSKLYDSTQNKLNISDDDLIKAYVYLTFISQTNSMDFDIRYLSKILVNKEISKYPKSNYKGITEELTNFNYKVIGEFVGTGENYWKHAEMFYRIQNKKIQSGYGFIETNTGIRREFPIWINI
jgi:hypothetical protein